MATCEVREGRLATRTSRRTLHSERGRPLERRASRGCGPLVYMWVFVCHLVVTGCGYIRFVGAETCNEMECSEALIPSPKPPLHLL